MGIDITSSPSSATIMRGFVRVARASGNPMDRDKQCMAKAVNTHR